MEDFCADAFVICADGGLDVAAQYGIVPDLLVGDFDSIQT
ncbi:MAG: thiamine diphosphokinase, partial [Faecalispora jeddahensis]